MSAPDDTQENSVKRKRIPDPSSDSKVNENKDLKLNNLNVSMQTFPYKSSSEYAAAVNQWLWQSYNWQCMAITLPYLVSQTACRNQVNNSDGTTDFNRNFPNTFFPNQNLYLSQQRRPNVPFQGQNTVANAGIQGTEYVIPSLWKRFYAEVIDCVILLVLKAIITYIAVDYFDLINLDTEDFDLIKNDKLDYHKAMKVTSEMITLEVIHRFVVCIFEALCLYKGMAGIGGATPGKIVMHLKVVMCHNVIPIDSNIVRVYPATDLGIGWAFLRAFIKNFSLAFIFPICFTMFFFQHNRTAYDIICNSIVVEETPPRMHRN